MLGGLSLALSIVALIVWKDILQLPWWGVLLATALAGTLSLPIGVIQATTNQVRPPPSPSSWILNAQSWIDTRGAFHKEMGLYCMQRAEPRIASCFGHDKPALAEEAPVQRPFDSHSSRRRKHLDKLGQLYRQLQQLA